jgi:Tfp pilus assembly protein PilW
MQETLRFALSQISRDIRMTSYRDVMRIPSTSVSGTQISFENGTGPNDSDSLTLQMFGDSDTNGVADNSVVDCQGTAIPHNTTRQVSYRVALVSGEPWLVCRIDGATDVNLFPGVETMQILVGEDLNGDKSADRFIAPDAANANNVVSVTVSLIVRSQVANFPTSATTFNHFGTLYAPGGVALTGDAGAVFTSPDDKRMRRMGSMTVSLRNRID